MQYIKNLDLNISPISFHGSKVNISRITHYKHEVDNSPFSIKLVLKREEVYWVNGKKYILKKDQFLLVDRYSKVYFDINCKSYAKGICFYPSLELISNIIYCTTQSDQRLLDQPEISSSQLEFTEKIYHLKETHAGQMISQYYSILHELHHGRFQFDWDTFMIQFCENLVKDQLKVNKLLSALPSRKKSTKEELYRRISEVKIHLDANFSDPIDLDSITEKSMLSKYHFVRSFKSLFGISPIKYLLQLRLSEAKKLRKQGCSYHEIANLVGFSDPRNLRKAMTRNS